MFADVDESIRRLLVERGNLNSGEIDVAFDMPTREWAAGISKPTLNVYLYDIRENLELKEPSPWQVRRGPNNTAIKSRPDVRLDLTYSITAFANAIEDEHRLLGRAMLVLFQNPILPEEILNGEVEGQEVSTAIAQPSNIIQSPADYWGSIDGDIKPSIDYRVTVRLSLAQEITVGLALTSQFRVGEKVNGNHIENVETLPYSIGGRIVQSGDVEQGIPEVAVTLLERALDTVTDDEGRYSFSGVPEGLYTLVISAPDRDEQRVPIEVPGSAYDVEL